jgi:hypothetical protein
MNPEPHGQGFEEFLAMLRVEQRSKLAELPSVIMTEVVWDDFFFTTKWPSGICWVRHDAAVYSGYNLHYSRRLLNNGAY